MTTQPLSAGIIAAPLAAIDRRALSQAWYSALHVCHSQPDGVSAVPRRLPARRPQPHRSAPAARTTRLTFAPNFFVKPAALGRDPRAGAPVTPPAERRTRPSALATRIERALAAKPQTPKRVAIAIDATGARAYLTLQTTRTGVRVVALCPARLRGAVARALTEARFALAARGIEVTACS